MSITISRVDDKGAAGTTTRTKKFGVKLYQASALVTSVYANPPFGVGGTWQVQWPVAIQPGDYLVVAGADQSSMPLHIGTPPPGDQWYSDASPVNKTIAELGVSVDPNSANVIGRIRSQQQFTLEHWGEERTHSDFSHPFYFATDADPVLTLRPGYGNPWKNLDGLKIRVPLWARPAGGSDGNMTIVQPDGWEINLWLAQTPNVPAGEIRCGFAKKVMHTGTGLQEPGDIGGITAAGFSNGYGVIRLPELKAGKIEHGLFIAVHGWHGRRWPGQLGGGTSGEIPDANAPAMGALIRLNKSESAIRALGGPAWRTAIWVAQAEYGMWVGDQSGSSIALQTESDVAAWAKDGSHPGADWCKSQLGVGMSASTQTLYDVDLKKDVQRTVYNMNWRDGMDWSALQYMTTPAH